METKEKFKRGDVVFQEFWAYGLNPNSGEVMRRLSIVYDDDGGEYFYIVCFLVDDDQLCVNLNNLGELALERLESTRLATEREQRILYNALAEKGYRWNDEIKRLEKY